MKHNFKKLNVWHQARKLTVKVYAITKAFPQNEQYGLSSQMRKAAVSVVSNIAERSGRDSKKEMAYFLNVAIGSLCEVEAQIYTALDLNYIRTSDTEAVLRELNEIRMNVCSLRKHVLNNP